MMLESYIKMQEVIHEKLSLKMYISDSVKSSYRMT